VQNIRSNTCNAAPHAYSSVDVADGGVDDDVDADDDAVVFAFETGLIGSAYVVNVPSIVKP